MTPPLPALREERGGVGRSARRFVLSVLLVVAVVAAGLTMLGILRSETGSAGLLVGAALAFVPVVGVVAAFVWVDRWEPEPVSYLVQAVAWGATVAALLSVLVNSAATQVLPLEVVAVGVAPFVEEAAKGAFLVVFVWLHRNEFDGTVDGIVLGGLVGAGFAFTENVLYFGRAYTTGLVPDADGDVTGLAAAGATFVLRGVLSPFAHPLFTVLTGLGIGAAVLSANRAVKVVAPLLGYLAAVGLHALWNAAAVVADGRGFLQVYLYVMLPIFAGAVALAVWSRRREGAVLQRQLPAYVAAGWLAPWEVTVLASLPYRRRALQEARELGGEPARAATKAYHAAATDLAFLRERAVRGTAAPAAVAREATLLRELVAARRQAYVPRPTALVPPGR